MSKNGRKLRRGWILQKRNVVQKNSSVTLMFSLDIIYNRVGDLLSSHLDSKIGLLVVLYKSTSRSPFRRSFFHLRAWIYNNRQCPDFGWWLAHALRPVSHVCPEKVLTCFIWLCSTDAFVLYLYPWIMTFPTLYSNMYSAMTMDIDRLQIYLVRTAWSSLQF